MDSIIEEKTYLKEEEIDEWINGLYENDNEFEIEFKGKRLKFQKRIPMTVAFEISKINGKGNQMYAMIEVMSVQPHISRKQAARLPQDLMMRLKPHLQELFPEDGVKK